MAHSYVSAFEHELEAFRAFGRAAPVGTILLLDTYGTVATEDVLALAEEPPPPGAEPLLATVMEGGKAARPLPTLPAARAHCPAAVGSLPEAVRRLRGAQRYPVAVSAALLERQRALKSGIIAFSRSLQADVPIVA